MNRLARGFTLVEMVVIAPVVILSIGGFIAVIVNMTGDVISSRGSSAMTFEIQDSLNRIEQDVKSSTTFLAQNNIQFTSSNPQGLGSDGTGDFANVGVGGAKLILAMLATNGNPLNEGVGNIYLNNTPDSCGSGDYTNNTPLYVNIIYFVDDNNTLWRRTVMPRNYSSSDLCGGQVYQQPSCSPGWTHSFCKTDDIMLLEDVSSSGFSINYHRADSTSSAIPQASNLSLSPAQRAAALVPAQSVKVVLGSDKYIAGQKISHSGDLFASRLEGNAAAISEAVLPSIASTAPVISSARVINSGNVKFDWRQLAGAENYSVSYRVSTNGGSSWGSWYAALNGGSALFSNTNRTYTVTVAKPGDRVELRVRGVNSLGQSPYANKSIDIPLMTQLPLRGGWVNYNAGYSPVQFTRSADGVVMLSGLARYGAIDNDTLLGILPAGHRPTDRLIFRASEGSGSVARVDVRADGRIYLVRTPTGGGSWLSLSGISFLASDAPVTRVPLSLLSGWTNYGGDYAPLTSAYDNSGRVHLQGLVNAGTIASGTTIASFPTTPQDYRSSENQFFSAMSGNSFNEVGFKNGITTTTISKTGWTSVQGMYYATGKGSWSTPALQNSWTRYNTTYPTLQYSKGSDGIVTLRGMVKGGTTTNDTVVASLPAGYRPSYRQIFPIVSNHAHGRVDINANGSIMVRAPISATWVSVDGVSFMAEN